MIKKSPKYYTPEAALLKLQQYCAYQERCHNEVRIKLLELGIRGDALEDIISKLIQENFLNEERFAKMYAGGKFRIKRWGRIRILQELKMRRISEYCIKKALAEIPEQDYQDAIKEVIAYKMRNLEEQNPLLKKQKIAQYVIGRGFEAELVWGQLQNFIEQ